MVAVEIGESDDDDDGTISLGKRLTEEDSGTDPHAWSTSKRLRVFANDEEEELEAMGAYEFIPFGNDRQATRSPLEAFLSGIASGTNDPRSVLNQAAIKINSSEAVAHQACLQAFLVYTAYMTRFLLDEPNANMTRVQNHAMAQVTAQDFGGLKSKPIFLNSQRHGGRIFGFITYVRDV